MSTLSATDPRTLSVAVVEGIHAAAVRGRTALVEATVAILKDATLPGLIEYLCLRHAHGETIGIPPLPEAVRRSAVGAALDSVCCPFGFRQVGFALRNTSLNPSEVEYFALTGETDYAGHNYRLFETRWARAAEAVGLRGVQSQMLMAMTAMSENAIIHATSSVGVLVGYRMFEDAVLFTVADLGIGVLNSIRSSARYAGVQHPRDALRLALRPGVTCLDAPGGYGFRDLFKALVSYSGTIRLRTGNVCITMDGQNFDADLGDETFPEPIPGFQVTMCCRKQISAQGRVFL